MPSIFPPAKPTAVILTDAYIRDGRAVIKSKCCLIRILAGCIYRHRRSSTLRCAKQKGPSKSPLRCLPRTRLKMASGQTLAHTHTHTLNTRTHSTTPHIGHVPAYAVRRVCRILPRCARVVPQTHTQYKVGCFIAPAHFSRRTHDSAGTAPFARRERRRKNAVQIYENRTPRDPPSHRPPTPLPPDRPDGSAPADGRTVECVDIFPLVYADARTIYPYTCHTHTHTHPHIGATLNFSIIIISLFSSGGGGCMCFCC